jgi:MOSC domain-containing protein YiiM
MMRVETVNIGVARPTIHSDVDFTGIDKRPTDGPVPVSVPGESRSGLAGDTICDLRHHGGPDQAVYAYAREDLDAWAAELDRDLPNGVFGENLTTNGMDLTNAVIGERWAIGDHVELEVSVPRIPCRTFAGWLAEQGWIKTFTQRAAPGTYLRVIAPGQIQAGDPITITHRPTHGVTVGETFRALTTEPALLPRLLTAPELPPETQAQARRRLPNAAGEDN